MYSIQQNLFSFEEWLQLDSKDRLPLFFSALELTPYAKALASASPQGRNGTCKQSTLRALLAAHMEGITTFTALHKRLDNDLRFRYQCGFPLNEAPPSISTISRVFKKLIKKKLAERLFNDLVIQCREAGIIKGDKVAIDSAQIKGYEKKLPKSKCVDPAFATWGAKFDEFRNKITWFGYKIHIAVDTNSEIPTALEVTPAHVKDGDLGPLLVKDHVSKFKEILDVVLMDAGYDQLKNYKIALKYGAQALIPLNLRNEKEPPAGYSSNGTPRCSMGYDMTYWGSEKNYLKFRCPHVVGKVDCPHERLGVRIKLWHGL